MEQEKVKKLLNEKAKLQKAAEEIISLLIKAGFMSSHLSVWEKSIRFDPTATSLISLDIANDKLAIKVESRIVITTTYERLKKLAKDRGWTIERI